MRCPRCREAMATRVVSGGRLRRCEGCDGIWAEAGQLARIVQTEEDLRNVFPPRAQTRFRCPQGCGAYLEELQYSTMEEALLLDCCPVCLGLYLDRGEMELVMDLNDRIRKLFGDGTFRGPPPKRGFRALLWGLFG